MLVLVKCFCSLFTDSVIEICCFAVLQFGLSCKIPGKNSEFLTLKVFFFFFFFWVLLAVSPPAGFALWICQDTKMLHLYFCKHHWTAKQAQISKNSHVREEEREYSNCPREKTMSDPGGVKWMSVESLTPCQSWALCWSGDQVTCIFCCYCKKD